MKAFLFAIAVLSACGSNAPPPSAPVENAAPPKPTPAPEPAAPLPADMATGFDLYVTPDTVTTWRIDGEARTERLPSRIRGIATGHHSVEIEPPPGFLGARADIDVDAGKSHELRLTLQPAPSAKP
ncbi:MAG TPA: hypothetical protein VGM90_29680 [Kofleriaceae bacterium]|jgi:hypothetical protein